MTDVKNMSDTLLDAYIFVTRNSIAEQERYLETLDLGHRAAVEEKERREKQA